MYFIIIHSTNFDDFLSVKRVFDKDKKQVDVVSLYNIDILNSKNNKRHIKKFNTYIQVK